MSGMPPRPYHHGDLPNALKAAAAELIMERGPAGFSLREVARRAGVSHAAPAHHFGDSTGLLTALAADGFRELGQGLAAAIDGTSDPMARLEAVARAYVALAVARPAHYAVMFRTDLIDVDNPACSELGAEAHGLLLAALEAVRRDLNPGLDVVTAADLSWSAMHGLVELYPRMVALSGVRGHDVPPIDELAARFARLILHGLAPGLPADARPAPASGPA